MEILFFLSSNTTNNNNKNDSYTVLCENFHGDIGDKIFSLTKETNQNLLYIFLLPFPHCHMSLCPTSKYTTMTQKFVTNIKRENCLFDIKHFLTLLKFSTWNFSLLWNFWFSKNKFSNAIFCEHLLRFQENWYSKCMTGLNI